MPRLLGVSIANERTASAEDQAFHAVFSSYEDLLYEAYLPTLKQLPCVVLAGLGGAL